MNVQWCVMVIMSSCLGVPWNFLREKSFICSIYKEIVPKTDHPLLFNYLSLNYPSLFSLFLCWSTFYFHCGRRPGTPKPCSASLHPFSTNWKHGYSVFTPRDVFSSAWIQWCWKLQGSHSEVGVLGCYAVLNMEFQD